MSLPARAEEIGRFARQLLANYGLGDWSVTFNRRKREMGLCLFEPKLIQLSLHFVRLNSDELVRDTILHEIAHALVGPGHGHDPVWKKKCLEVGARPERLCDDVNMPLGRWQAVCAGCGMLHHRHRRPKHLIGWWCRYCGRERGRLIWQRAG
jgi:predicted SprT family Zn-dependent metalloprotease